MPIITAYPDGRIQFNTRAMRLLRWTGPITNEEPPPPEAVKMYIYRPEPSGKGYLVIERAAKDDPESIRLFPVGRKSERWPLVHVARAASILRRDLRIAIRARYRIEVAELDGRLVLVADLNAPEPVEPGLPTDELYNLLRMWVNSDEVVRGKPLTRRELYRHVVEFAKRRGINIPILQKQLSDYIFAHSDILRKELGIDIQTRAGGSPKYIIRAPEPKPEEDE